MWYKVISKTCYMFSPFFLFHWFSQVVTKITFTSETSVILLISKCLPSNASEKLFVKIVEHKLEKGIFVGIKRDVQLRHFNLLSVPISQLLPRLTSHTSFVFSYDR